MKKGLNEEIFRIKQIIFKTGVDLNIDDFVTLVQKNNLKFNDEVRDKVIELMSRID